MVHRRTLYKCALEQHKTWWGRGQGKSAYMSQECSRCHCVFRSNRPERQTSCCGVCGWQAHAGHNAAGNIARRLGSGRLERPGADPSSRRFWRRAINGGDTKPVGRSPTAQLLAQRAQVNG